MSFENLLAPFPSLSPGKNILVLHWDKTSGRYSVAHFGNPETFSTYFIAEDSLQFHYADEAEREAFEKTLKEEGRSCFFSLEKTAPKPKKGKCTPIASPKEKITLQWNAEKEKYIARTTRKSIAPS